MNYKIINPKINYFNNNYLSSLDIINKYNLKDKKKVPFIKKITISFPLSAFQNKFFEVNKTEFDSEIHIKSLLFCYLVFGNIPFIKSKKQSQNLKLKIQKSSFALKISLNTPELINKFLYQIFFENLNKIEDFHISKKKYNNTLLGLSIPIQNFMELKRFINTLGVTSTSNEFFLDLKLFLNQKIYSDYTFKNICPFWVQKKIYKS